MPRSKETLKARLTRYRQIKIRVIGRKSGQTISIPVWFVLEGEKLYLLPVQGSDTQYYKNLLAKASISDFSVGSAACFTSLFACTFDSLLDFPCTFQSGVGGPLA